MLKILIADDHAVVRRGLAQILSEDLEDAELGEAASAAEVIDKVRSETWDAILLDVALPDRSGLEALREIRQTHPALPVLVLSVYPENQYALQALKFGASGYITKASAPDELVRALKTVLGGGKIRQFLTRSATSHKGIRASSSPPRRTLFTRTTGISSTRVGPVSWRDRGDSLAEREDRQHIQDTLAREDRCRYACRACPVRACAQALRS